MKGRKYTSLPPRLSWYKSISGVQTTDPGSIRLGRSIGKSEKNELKTLLQILQAICCTCRHCGMRKKVLSIRMTLIGSESSKRNLFTKRLLTKFKLFMTLKKTW